MVRPNGDIRIDGMAPFVIGNILTDDFIEALSLAYKKSLIANAVGDFYLQSLIRLIK